MMFKSLAPFVIIIFLLVFIISCGQTESRTDKSFQPVQKTEVKILSLSEITKTTEQYNLTFVSKNDTTQKLAMSIGNHEAQILAITLEKLKPAAPLPLDVLE